MVGNPKDRFSQNEAHMKGGILNNSKVPIHCWVKSEGFKFQPEWKLNLPHSALKSSVLTARPRRPS